MLEDISLTPHENVVYQKLKHIDEVILRVLSFEISMLLHDICIFMTL